MKIIKSEAPMGRNGLSSKRAFAQRKRYIRVAYPLISKENGIDFWHGDQVLFGKIDREAYSIVVRERFIKHFDSSPEYRALNFVVDAFEALLAHIREGFSGGNLSVIDTFLLTIAPTKAYEDPIEDYQRILTDSVEFYAGPWLEGSKGSVKNFDDFVDKFLEFGDVILQKSPITLTDYIISDFCPHRFTGLVVEFKDLSYDNDKIKWDKILRDRNFVFFQNAARKFGFKLDYNVPWRLVADITTKEMKKFMFNYGIGSVEDLFEQYYERTDIKDIDFLRATLITYYNSLVRREPVIKIPMANPQNLNTTKLCEIRRKPLLESEIPDEKFWVEFYFRVRMKEAGIVWHPHLLENKIKHLKRLYDLFDFGRVMRYIDNQIFENARG